MPGPLRAWKTGPAISPHSRRAGRSYGGHGLSFATVRRALLQVKGGGVAQGGRNLGQFGSITDLLGLPDVYELERRYATPATG